MNLFGLNIRISRSEPTPSSIAPTTKSLSSSVVDWLRGEEGGGSGTVLLNAYEQVVWVYRAINVLAEQVANIPFLFSAGERGQENLITSGPLCYFYDRPHPYLNRFQYWELRIIWLMLRGECFRVPIYEDEAGRLAHSRIPLRAGNRAPRLKQVLLLDPARFEHIVQDHQLIGWRYTGLGPNAPLASQVFLPEEVWFEKLPNPFDFWRGFPPLYVAGTAARTDFAASAFMRGIIENNADSGIIVRTDHPLADEQQAQIIAALVQRKRRAGTPDRPVFLNGVTEIVKPQLSSSDMQFLENRRFSRAEICAAFGVPEEIVATTDYAKYNVMTGARLNFIENRIAPLCRRLEAEEDVTVRAIEPLASGWFDLDSLPILQDARRSRLTAARTGFEMGVPFNQLNRVLDLGFKPLPWGDRGYLAGKLTEVGEAPQNAPGPDSKKFSTADLADNGGNFVGHAEEFFGALASGRPRPATRHQLGRALRRFFFEQRGRVLANCLAEPKPPGAPGAASAPLRLEPPLDLIQETARLGDCLKPFVVAELQAGAGPLPAQGAAASSRDTFQTAYFRTRGPDWSGINARALTALEDILQQARAMNETQDQLAARIKSFYNRVVSRWPDEIARDEAAAALVAASAAVIEDIPEPVRVNIRSAQSPEKNQ